MDNIFVIFDMKKDIINDFMLLLNYGFPFIEFKFEIGTERKLPFSDVLIITICRKS